MKRSTAFYENVQLQISDTYSKYKIDCINELYYKNGIENFNRFGQILSNDFELIAAKIDNEFDTTHS